MWFILDKNIRFTLLIGVGREFLRWGLNRWWCFCNLVVGMMDGEEHLVGVYERITGAIEHLAGYYEHNTRYNRSPSDFSKQNNGFLFGCTIYIT